MDVICIYLPLHNKSSAICLSSLFFVFFSITFILSLPAENVHLKSSFLSAEQPCYAKPVSLVAQDTTVVLTEKLEGVSLRAGPYQRAHGPKPSIYKKVD